MCKPKHRIMCPDCGREKILFESESKANNFIKFNGEELGNNLRAYYCPACCGWYISSKQYSSKYEGRTDKLIYAYKNEKKLNKNLEPIINKLYNILKEHSFATKHEMKLFFKQNEFDNYGTYAKIEARNRYCKEFNIKN